MESQEYQGKWSLDLLKKECENVVRECEEKTAEYEDQIKKECEKYNAVLMSVAGERTSLRTPINDLHKFLRTFGDIGKRITSFEYAHEQNLHHKSDSTSEGKGMTKNSDEVQDSWIKKTIRVLVPPIALIDMVVEHSKNQSQYKELREEYEKYCAEWDEKKKEYEEKLKFYKDAVKMAEMFYRVLTSIKERIEETIIPELRGVKAFMTADAIRNCIINDENPENAQIGDICEYENTIYEQHYMFVKNSCDYYQIIAKFYTETVLTNIIEDNCITRQEKQDFERSIHAIGQKEQELLDNVVFGGKQ